MHQHDEPHGKTRSRAGRALAALGSTAAGLALAMVAFVAAPASAADAAGPALATTGQSAPWIAGIIAAVLVVGGGLFFWFNARKRRAEAGAGEDAATDADDAPGL